MVNYVHFTASNHGRQQGRDSQQSQLEERAQNGGGGASLRSKIFQMLLHLYIENSGGGDGNITQKKVMALLHDEQLMSELIPREDPYYQ